MNDDSRPKIRRLQVSAGQWQGQPVAVLQDPLGIIDRAVAVPRDIVPLLELCDGTRDVSTLSTALELRTGFKVSPDYIRRMLNELDEALLLENERFTRAYRDTVDTFRAAPYRLSSLAGAVYPADPEGLERTFKGYFDSVSPEVEDIPEVGRIRGLVSPHIDYARGAAIYARVWRQAAAAVREVDMAVILGTNHQNCRNLITLTRQNYFTPWGILPTAVDVVDELAASLGEEVFAEELHHRPEHSIEIVAVWLHYLVKDRACMLVPVLCGSFQRFIEGAERPDESREIELLVNTVRKAAEGRRTLIVAAGDLAHVGPAFGDSYPIGPAEKAGMSAADAEMMDAVSKGDAGGLFALVKQEGDRRRICGLPPIYLALRILGETTGRVAGYAQCPADQQETSFVSICGMVLS